MSIIGDLLASGFNIFSSTWTEASAPTMIELTLIMWFSELFGFPKDAGGSFLSGGSVAILTAMFLAREEKVTGDVKWATAYCSDQTHHAVNKALKVIGIPIQNLRIIPSNENCQINIKELSKKIEEDNSKGFHPFVLIANVGTTNTGAIDSICDLRKVSDAYNLWLHGDGAFGAALALFSNHQLSKRELGQLDSLSFNPHKWFFQQFESGLLIVKDKKIIKKSFNIKGSYMGDVGDEYNVCDHTIELSRAFRSLKVWMTINTFGLEKINRAISRGYYLAYKAEEIIKGYSCWEIVTSASCGIVTFRFKDSEKEDVNYGKLVDRLLQEGYAFFSTTTLRGNRILRICTINQKTDIEEIRLSLDYLTKVALEVWRR